MAMRLKKWLIKVILDTFSLLVVTILLLVFYLWVPPVQRGFYCDDVTIRYPYRENTINEYLLFVLVLVPVLTTIPAIELFRYRSVCKK
jgi:phosphatidate phosphatase